MLSVPAGTVVEFAHSEALSHDRVSPWVTLSAGDSCTPDDYVARGGEAGVLPAHPQGRSLRWKFTSLAPPDQVEFLREEVVERCYYGDAEGEFPHGRRIAQPHLAGGVATHLACSEDSLVDNPTRERGQWAGDVVGVGMDVAAVAFSYLR